MVGLCEGLLFAHAAGLDVDAWLGAVRGGAAGSRSLELYAPRLRGRDFEPGFFVKARVQSSPHVCVPPHTCDADRANHTPPPHPPILARSHTRPLLPPPPPPVRSRSTL